MRAKATATIRIRSRVSFVLLGVLAPTIFHLAGATVSPVGLHCPDPLPILELGLAGARPCDDDCKINHGTGQGICVQTNSTVSENCVCSGAKVTATNCAVYGDLLDIPIFCQCGVNEGDLVLGPLFALQCEIDCKCFHGARGGSCNWLDYSGPNPELLHSSCICDYPAGWNSANASCPVEDVWKLGNLTQQILQIQNGGLLGVLG